jgi:hypothetical protein
MAVAVAVAEKKTIKNLEKVKIDLFSLFFSRKFRPKNAVSAVSRKNSNTDRKSAKKFVGRRSFFSPFFAIFYEFFHHFSSFFIVFHRFSSFFYDFTSFFYIKIQSPKKIQIHTRNF